MNKLLNIKREATRLRVQRFRAVRRKIDINNETRELPMEPSTSTNDQKSVDHPLESVDFEDDRFMANFENKEREHQGKETSSEMENEHVAVTTQMDVSCDEVEFEPLPAIAEETQEDESSFSESCSELENSTCDEEACVEKEDEALHAHNEITKLREWAMKSNIPQTHLDELLGILRQRLLPDLPVSSKTFLKTSYANYDIQKFKNNDGSDIGEFVYFGLTKHLESCVNTNLHPDKCIYLQINMDGLPLFKSSNKQFWPILCKVHYEPDIYPPFPVAVYAGNGKPENLNHYLDEFIEEINGLLDTGIQIDGISLKVRIHCFICDTPARSFVKCTKGHGGYYACERCTVHGSRFERRTIYDSLTCQERSDQSFRNQENPEHHNAVSPLTMINPGLDMVSQFVLDFMHLCCLGVMKKLLVDFWLQGDRSTKLSQRGKCLMSQLLIGFQSQIPNDFQRTTRSISEVAKWKATEFRFFLLYCGPIVLKRVLPKNLYQHFLLFHVACRILCSRDLASKYNRHAKVYLSRFVGLALHYYGKESQVMNFHNLIHLADDAKNLDCSLSEVTAFPFENTLGKMKRMLRSGNRPLAQLCRRLHETCFANIEKATLPPTVVILKQQRTDPTGIIHVKKLKYKESLLSTNSPDNTVSLKDGKILRIDNLLMRPGQHSDDLEVTGTILRIRKPIFTYPCDSASLKMWEVIDGQESLRVTYPLKSMITKMVTLSIMSDDASGQKLYTMPFLHM